MLNVIIPMASKSIFFEDEKYIYPKPLIEINGKTMIQHVVENLKTITQDIQFIFIVSNSDCSKYHLDSILKLIAGNDCIILKLDKETKGAACSVLMAIEYINNDEPLVIANSDQIIAENLNSIISAFQKKNVDAGVVCFETVHPRWSFVRLNEQNKIMETAEKRPLSKNAIAGFYYFKKGSFFIDAAMNSIEKDANVNGIYYIAPVLNEMVLKNLNMEIYKIANEKYHTFYSPQKIEEFEKKK